MSSWYIWVRLLITSSGAHNPSISIPSPTNLQHLKQQPYNPLTVHQSVTLNYCCHRPLRCSENHLFPLCLAVFFAFQSREPPGARAGNAGVTLHVLTSLKCYASRLRDYLWIIQYHWQRPFQIAYPLFFVSSRFKRFKVSRCPITKNKVCGLILKIIWINISLNFNFSKRCLLYQDLYRLHLPVLVHCVSKTPPCLFKNMLQSNILIRKLKISFENSLRAELALFKVLWSRQSRSDHHTETWFHAREVFFNWLFISLLKIPSSFTRVLLMKTISSTCQPFYTFAIASLQNEQMRI